MERTCASLDEYGPDRSRAEIRELGQAIATGGLEPETWVLCEARQTSQDRGQELWLGRTVPAVRVAAGGLGPDAMDMEAKEDGT